MLMAVIVRGFAVARSVEVNHTESQAQALSITVTRG
jgi:hypothetical protein